MVRWGWSRRLMIALGCLSIVAGPAAGLAAPSGQVIYYNQGNGLAAEDTFGFKVLKLALAKSGHRYILKPSPLGRVTEQRAMAAIAARNNMDLAMLGTSTEADAKLAAIPIPIDRGLLGYRVLLIDGARQDAFSRVRTLRDLQGLSALQGKGWPDVAILRNAGVTVWTGTYEKLFAMTLAGRADFFPRGILEAFGEAAKQRPLHPNLAVEKTLVLRYRFTSMFYVARTNRVLYDDLHRGFVRAFDDGSYDKLFREDRQIRSALAAADLKRRTVIEIDNPYLSPATRAIAERYWYRP